MLAYLQASRSWPASSIATPSLSPRPLRAAGGAEWTSAPTKRCARQPEMLAIKASVSCIAELMTLAGAWPAALDEARRAAERRCRAFSTRERWARPPIARESCIDCAERLLRLRSPSRRRFAVDASRSSGFALLRLGQAPAAAASVWRAKPMTGLRRASLLPAQVEIEVAVGGRERARAAASELDDIARDHPSEVLFAMAAKAAGVVAVAEGDAQRALLALRRALHLWQELEVPYEAARTVCSCPRRAERSATGRPPISSSPLLVRLSPGSARPDIACVETLAGRTHGDAHGLTARELEVLRVLAAGKSNREIAVRSLSASARLHDTSRTSSPSLASPLVPRRACSPSSKSSSDGVK